MIDKSVLTAKQAREELGVSRPTFYKLLLSGALRAYRVGKVWRIDKSELQAFKDNGGYNKTTIVNNSQDW